MEELIILRELQTERQEIYKVEDKYFIGFLKILSEAAVRRSSLK